MKDFYKFLESDYTSVVHEKVLLFNHYEKISSFLSQVFGPSFSNFLAKPIVKNSEVSWYSVHDQVKQVSDLSFDEQNALIKQYWNVREKIDLKIEEFESENSTEKDEWAEILKKVFDEKNNILFTDEDAQNVIIIWGWEFNKEKIIPKSDDYLKFENRHIPIPVVQESTDDIDPEIESELNNEDYAQSDASYLHSDHENSENNTKRIRKKYYSYNERYHRTMRYYGFRYWWLYLLIFFSLVFLWWYLYNYCSYFNSCKKCDNISSLYKELDGVKSDLDSCCSCNFIDSVEVTDSVLPPENDFIERRIRENGCEGDITATLIWNSKHDLDLHCIDPNGQEIYYPRRKRRSRSGGELDVDMNAGGRHSLEPVENICWKKIPPNGHYKFGVRYFSRGGGGAGSVPYQLLISYGGKNKVINGVLNRVKEKQWVFEFTYPS